MKDLKVLTVESLHTTIFAFIEEGSHIIGDYNDMKEIILLMIRAGYVFNMDRDRLRDAMEELTYMLCPEDDINKDRVIKGLEYDDTDSEDDYVDDDDEDDDDEDGPPQGGQDLEIVDVSGDEIEDITPQVSC